MRFQFSTRTLLLAMASVAICIGGTIEFWRSFQIDTWERAVLVFGFMLPILFPCFFVGFVAGRRTMSPIAVVVFAVCETIAAGFYLLVTKR